MSENDIRMDADKWECELMEEKMARLQQERDEAVALSEGKDKTINTLTRMYWDVKRSCSAALETVKRRKTKNTGKLWAALAIVAAVALLDWIGMRTGTLSALVGGPVIILCAVVGSFLAGWLFERLVDNFKLQQKVSKYRQGRDCKGE